MQHRLPLALCLLTLLAACRPAQKQPATPPEVLVARERAAALFADERLREAEQVLRPLVARRPPAAEDLVSLAICRLSGQSLDQRGIEEVVALLEEARKLDPKDPRAEFNLGRVRYDWGRDFELAVENFRRAAELAPADVPTRIFYAQLLLEIHREQGDPKPLGEAVALLDGVLAEGLENAGSWYLTALYARWSAAGDQGDDGLARALLSEHSTLVARGIPQPTQVDLQRGNLGRLLPPAPEPFAIAPLAAPALGPARVVPGVDGNALRSLATWTARAEWVSLTAAELGVPAPENRDPETYPAGGEIGPSGLVASDGERVLWAFGEGGGWRAREIHTGAHSALLGLDLEADWEGRTAMDPGISLGEIVLADPDGAVYALRLGEDPGARAERTEIARLPGAAEQLLAVDLDHEGDLDLIAVGAFGVRYLRSDGTDPEGGAAGFSDATSNLAVPPGRSFAWALAEDFDSDGDTDLLLGGPGGLLWLDSLRKDRFQDRTADLPAGVDGTRRPLAADFNGDGFVDLWFPATGERLWNRFGQRFERAPNPEGVGPVPAPSTPVAVDLDLDGALDVLWIDGQGRLSGQLALGRSNERSLAPVDLGARPGPLAIADWDGLFAFQVAYVSRDGALCVRSASAGEGRGLRLSLRGIKDNSRGVGAVVELRAGANYRRLRFGGESELLGLGRAERADVVRVTWPNGVVQSILDAAPGTERVVEQVEGLIGSCPFLYVWNGETYEFITDVLGITPLGLPMAPGVLVPPDHDEYVLVRGEQMAPKDGHYSVQITEELREVTYLDQVRLHVIDHPEGSELFPNERFTFPPFPQHELHLVQAPLAPLSAIDQDGRDWAAELAAEDGQLAIPFTSQRGQFLGLASPHTLELRFDPESIAGAPRLRLVMCGWFYWTDASVNMAAARHPDVEFVPPLFEVPDGAGGWRSAGPPPGFPAGKLKTMVVEATDWWNREDPRVRIHSTLRLYWDSIRLDTTSGDTPRVETVLEPSFARLWERGFSATVWLHEAERLEWFDWSRLASEPRWNQHPGRYTRHGDVLELLERVDDRFAIFGAGDAIEVRFPAEGLPPLPPGWRRDYLLFLDGWAKDRDPNTHEALEVEPLPFHGMSAYPYGPDEAYPDTEATRAYRRTYNTRPAKQWLAPLAPKQGDPSAP